MPTVDAFAQDIADEFGENYADADTAAQLQAWVSEVINEIYAAGRWNFSIDSDSITTAASTKDYDLDVDTVEVVSLVRPNGDEITYVPHERLIARGYVLSTTGTPLHWYYSGINASNQARVIALYPVPDSIEVLTAHVFVRPGALAGATDIPLPYEFLQPLRDGVRAKLKANDGHLQEAQLYEQRYMQGAQLMQQRLHGTTRPPSRLPIKQIRQQHQGAATPTGG